MDRQGILIQVVFVFHVVTVQYGVLRRRWGGRNIIALDRVIYRSIHNFIFLVFILWWWRVPTIHQSKWNFPCCIVYATVYAKNRQTTSTQHMHVPYVVHLIIILTHVMRRTNQMLVVCYVVMLALIMWTCPCSQPQTYDVLMLSHLVLSLWGNGL